MNHKVRKLFADSQIKMRLNADQDEFVQNNMELLNDAVSSFNQAMDMMLDEKSRYAPRYRDKNWAATTLNGFAVGLIRDKHPSRMRYKNGCWSYYGSKAIVKFKKLDDKFLPGNVKTDNAELERHQKALFSDSSWPIIYVGYSVNKAMTEITGCYAVCIDNWKNVKWIIDLDDVVSQQVTNVTMPIDPVVDRAVEYKEPLVKAKAGKQRKANE